MAGPQDLQFLPDGRLAYLQPGDNGATGELWAFDPGSADPVCLFRTVPDDVPGHGQTADLSQQDALEAELRSQRQRRAGDGIRAFLAGPGPGSGSGSGPDFLCVVLSQGIRFRHAGTQGDRWQTVWQSAGAMDVSVGADGASLAFVRNGHLYRCDLTLANPVPVRVTPDCDDGVTYATAEYVAQEELGRERGYVLSPDCRFVLLTRVDVRGIPSFPIVHEGADPAPWVEEHRYPFAGGPNARVDLWIMPFGPDRQDLAMLRPVPFEDFGDGYLARFAWTPDGKVLTVTLDRAQRRMRYTVSDPLGGTGPCVLWEEESKTWLNLPHPGDLRFLRDGSLLTTSETVSPGGFRHLVRIRPDGTVHPLTRGDWEVSEVVGVREGETETDPGGQESQDAFAVFIGTAEGPPERHVYRVPLGGGDPVRLTPEPGVHSAVMGAGGDLFADRFSSLVHPPITCLRSLRTGAITHRIHETSEREASSLGLRPPSLVNLVAADGTRLYGAVYRALDGTKRHAAGTPAVISVYGGPSAQRVLNDWSLTVDLEAQILARCGALVFKLDNRGSAHRGHAFEAPLHLRFGEAELDDQVRGVAFLVREYGADPARVGIYGWSYGGYMTLRALTRAPDVFACGVAGAPVTDFRWYDTAYTERYLETPATNPGGYASTSVFGDLGRLRAPLLIIHGLTDENVHFRHTARLLMALARLHRPFEILPLPENRHMLRDFDHRYIRTARTLEFLLRHLGLPGPAEPPSPSSPAAARPER